MNPLRTLVLLTSMLAAARFAAADDAPGAAPEAARQVSYHREVQRVLRKSCQGCHQPAKPSGKLVLTDYRDLMKGGRSQEKTPIVVPGKPEESLLYLEITPQEGEAPEMPKDAPPLAAAEVELVRDWILQGAKDDTPEGARETLVSMEHPPVYELAPVLTSVDYSPNGATLAVSGYHEVLLHDVAPETRGSGRLIARLVGLSERIQSVRFSPDGRQLAVTGGSPGRIGEVQMWDVENRKLRLSKLVTFDTLYGGAWSSDGRLFAFGCADNSVRAIETETGNQVLFQGAHNDWVLGVAFSADDSHLVSVSRDRTMKLIQVKTEQFIDNITSITPGALRGGLMTVDRHPSRDELLVGGADGAPKIYRMHREKARQIGDDFNLIRDFGVQPGRVFSVRYSADGSRIVAGSSDNGSGEIRVYETAEGKLLWKLPLDEGVYCVAFRPDGKEIAACGFGGAVRLLDAESGRQLERFIPVPLSF